MAKFYGAIGFAETVETEPGLWEEQITERYYYGDVVRNNRKLQTSSGVNDDINANNEISIVADEFAITNYYNMRYIVFMGVKWKIPNVEVQRPRLILTMGGVYNGQ